MSGLLNNIFQQRFFDNSFELYLKVIGAIILAVIAGRIISSYFTGFLYKLITKAGKKFNKEAFRSLLVRPLEVFIISLVTIVAIDQLRYPERWKLQIYKTDLSQILHGLGKATIICVFIWLCLRVIDFIAVVLEERANITKSQTDNQLIVFFKDFFKVLLVILGVLLLLRFTFNQNIGNLLTGLSIVGAAIALATRESLENLIASFIIFFDKPFVTGDTVKVHNFTGTVERIGLRSTRIRTIDKTYISVPNKQMVDSIVDNISLRTQRKAELRLELKLSVTTDEIRKLLSAIKSALQQQHIIKSAVHFAETGKNANVVVVEYFTGMQLTEDEYADLKEHINFKIMELIEQSGTDFATLNIDALISANKVKE
jgi:MscS family membrane protein